MLNSIVTKRTRTAATLLIPKVIPEAPSTPVQIKMISIKETIAVRAKSPADTVATFALDSELSEQQQTVLIAASKPWPKQSIKHIKFPLTKF
ncbi:hypothetical protein [Chlamydia pneumoniae J138]|nr:hypothetical protein [Chlamydia pneumoniae J138]